MIAEVVPRISRYCGLEKGVMIWLIVAVLPLDIDLVGKIFRIVPHAPDETRATARKPWQAQEVHAGNRGDTTPLDRVAAIVKDTVDLQPGVVDTESGRPDHGGHARVSKVEFENRVRHAVGFRAEDVCFRLGWQIEAVAFDVLIGLAQQGEVVVVTAGDVCA